MDQLEDSTLDLIYRRRVRSYYPGYVIIFLVIGIALALPLVKVDIVTSTRGMVRPLKEPVELFAPITGILDSTILGNNAQVNAGDTIAWIRNDLPDARIESHRKQIRMNQGSIADILSILEGKNPGETTRFKQSYRNHLSTLSHLTLQKEFLHGEFRTVEKLYQEEVISHHEFEKTKSSYLIMVAKVLNLQENYRNILEEELYRFQLENSQMESKIDLICSTMQDYYIIVPTTGTVQNCSGIASGSVVHPGMSLGTISPSGILVAECYLEPEKFPLVGFGTRAKLRFDGLGFRHYTCLETVVDYIDKDVVMMNGLPVYRIRCTLDSPRIMYSNGNIDPVKKGMTFTASFILFRRSLASLIVDKMNGWANPAISN